MTTIYIHPGERLVVIASVGSKLGELDIDVADHGHKATIGWKNATLADIYESEKEDGA